MSWVQKWTRQVLRVKCLITVYTSCSPDLRYGIVRVWKLETGTKVKVFGGGTSGHQRNRTFIGGDYSAVLQFGENSVDIVGHNIGVWQNQVPNWREHLVRLRYLKEKWGYWLRCTRKLRDQKLSSKRLIKEVSPSLGHFCTLTHLIQVFD